MINEQSQSIRKGLHHIWHSRPFAFLTLHSLIFSKEVSMENDVLGDPIAFHSSLDHFLANPFPLESLTIYSLLNKISNAPSH